MNDFAASGPSTHTSTNSKAPVARLATSNLRFQRRTSERAYYEGALRDGSSTPTMDYSAASGSSPWASSPEASRTSLGDDQVSRQELPGPAIAEQHRSVENGDGNGEAEEERGPQYGYHGYNHGQQGSSGSGEENRRPQSARYHHQASRQQHQQQQHHQQPPQHQPQYKLQAKITGLERTGKKDPILRFDVYVCHVYPPLSVSTVQHVLTRPCEP